MPVAGVPGRGLATRRGGCRTRRTTCRVRRVGCRVVRTGWRTRRLVPRVVRIGCRVRRAACRVRRVRWRTLRLVRSVLRPARRGAARGRGGESWRAALAKARPSAPGGRAGRPGERARRRGIGRRSCATGVLMPLWPRRPPDGPSRRSYSPPPRSARCSCRRTDSRRYGGPRSWSGRSR